MTEVTTETLQGYLAEGQTLDETYAPRFVEALNKAGSRGELAQALMALQGDMQEAAAEQTATQWAEQMTEWKDAVKADPTYGGANMEQSLANARVLVEEYGGTRDPQTGAINVAEVAEVKQLLATTGVGNNIALVRLLNNLKNAIPGEAAPVDGKPKGEAKSRADRLFGA